jgi:hypothetical protein
MDLDALKIMVEKHHTLPKGFHSVEPRAARHQKRLSRRPTPTPTPVHSPRHQKRLSRRPTPTPTPVHSPRNIDAERI